MANSLPSMSVNACKSWSLDSCVYPVALLAHSPMLVEWAKNMWRKEHYQFFPLLLAFVAWNLTQAWWEKRECELARENNEGLAGRAVVGENEESEAGGKKSERGERVENREGEGAVFAERKATMERKASEEHKATMGQKATVARNAAMGLLMVNGLLVGVSALAFSPFFIIPALMLLIASAFVAHQGWTGFRRIAPSWLLLLFVVPLPLQWDSQLIQQLQFLASQLASYILDAVGQIHFREGVVLATHSHNFLAEEACSGIRSLFSSLTVMAAYGVLHQYSAGRQLFNLLQTMVWVIAGNAIRIAIIILVAEHGTMAIASGPAHEALGLVIFILIFLLALSTDRLLDLQPPDRQPESESLQWSS